MLHFPHKEELVEGTTLFPPNMRREHGNQEPSLLNQAAHRANLSAAYPHFY